MKNFLFSAQQITVFIYQQISCIYAIKIGKTQMDRILKLKDELTDYYTNRSFTNDTDLKYLRKIQET
mgnify:CR=1 FL=1